MTASKNKIAISAALVLLAAIAAGFLFWLQNKSAFFLNDNARYYSCVGNSRHAAGINDCTFLLAKLEHEGSFTLKDLGEVNGNYWLAELLSYRGRHYLRDGNREHGKADFKRAFRLQAGEAVVTNNLAEAGLLRDELFEAEQDAAIESIQTSVFCQVAGMLLGEENSDGYNDNVTSAHSTATNACVLSEGKPRSECQEITNERIKDTFYRAGRIFNPAPEESVRTEYAKCSL